MLKPPKKDEYSPTYYSNFFVFSNNNSTILVEEPFMESVFY